MAVPSLLLQALPFLSSAGSSTTAGQALDRTSVMGPGFQMLAPVAGEMTWAARQQRKYNRDQWKKMMRGDLGPSQNQQAAQLGATSRAISAQGQQATAEALRQSRNSGAGLEQMKAVQQARTAGIGAASGQVQAQAAQQAEAERANVLASNDAQADRGRAMWANIAKQKPGYDAARENYLKKIMLAQQGGSQAA